MTEHGPMRFHGPGECPVPTTGKASEQVNRVSIALLQEQVESLRLELRDRNLELGNWKIDHKRQQANIAALEAALARADKYSAYLERLLSGAPDHFKARHGITLPNCGYLQPDPTFDGEDDDVPPSNTSTTMHISVATRTGVEVQDA